MKRIHPFVTLTLLAAVSACNDVASPTSPLRPGDLPPAFGIFDGAHNGGNDRFFFLPPMVPRPTINAEFHAGLRPRVDICELANDVCVSGPSFKSFSSAEVRVSVADQHYHVNWDTKSPDVDPAKNYRIQVFLGDNRIGFADVDPVTNGSQLKHIQSDEFIGLVDGRTLPIKFFIGKGVTCTNRDNCAEYTVKSAEGGEFAAADERFWLEFPTDVFPAGFEEVTITVERKPVAASRICHALHLEGESDEDSEPALAAEYEGCYRVTMDRRSEDFIGAGGFQKPVTVAMCLTGTSLTNRFLRIYKSDPQPRGLVALDDADPAVIEGFDSSCEGFGPTPPPSPGGTLGVINSGLRYLASAIGRALSPKPLYAVDLGLGGQIGIGGGFSDFGWGVEGRLDARSPLTRTVAPGTNQEFAVSVTGFTDHVGEAADPEHQPTEEPLPGVDVRFELILGGEVIASQTVQSVLEEGGEGEYTPQALAAATFEIASPGNYVVRATLAHSGRSPVSFAVLAEQVATTTTLRSTYESGQLSVVGQTVPLEASVSPAPSGGQVQFFDGEESLGIVPVGSGGTAALNVASLSRQVHSLTARFLGDGSHAPSTSSVFTLHMVEHFTTLAAFETALGDVGIDIQDFDEFDGGTPITSIFSGVLNVTSPFPNLVVQSCGDSNGLFGFGFEPNPRAPPEEGTANTFYDLLFAAGAARDALAFDITAKDPNSTPSIVEVSGVGTRTASLTIANGATEDTPIFVGIIATLPLNRVIVNEGLEGTSRGAEEMCLDNFRVVSAP